MKLSKANDIVLYCAMFMSFTGGMSAAFVMLTVMSDLGEEVFLLGGMVDMLIGIVVVKYATEKTKTRKVLLGQYKWIIAGDLVAIPLIVAGSLYDPSARYLLMCTVGVVFYFVTDALRNDCLHRQMSKDALTTYGQKVSRYSDMGSLGGMMVAYYITTLGVGVYTVGVCLLAVSSAVDTFALYVRINAKTPDTPVSEEELE